MPTVAENGGADKDGGDGDVNGLAYDDALEDDAYYDDNDDDDDSNVADYDGEIADDSSTPFARRAR